MLDTLVNMFVKTEVITFEMTRPQEPTAYVHEVLVPEVCIMLIQEDYDGISFDEAKEIMEDSVWFGNHLFRVDLDL